MCEDVSSSERTFLFTDIVGSTRLWERLPEAIPAVLALHDDLIRRAVLANEGRIFKTIGDAVCAVFDSAVAAAFASTAAQLAIHRADWSSLGLPAPLQVRMAIHSGAVEQIGSDFSGPALNRLSRILDTGHGGQILLSGKTADSIRNSMSPGFALREFGERRLRDVPGTERIAQLSAEELPTAFPPLKTLDRVQHNLPSLPTDCVGREAELATLCSLMSGTRTRLVTIVGPGGIGKTRLAIQAALELLDEFVDGAWFVDLTSITDASLVPNAVVRTLGIREEPGVALEQTLRAWLGNKRLLLMLDNCEQVIEGVADLAASLLRSGSGLRLLCTSREPLLILGERQQIVEPLAIPGPRADVEIGDLEEIPSVKLFLERSKDVQPSFVLNSENASDVSEICRLLEGIPLAIELAAARITILTPAQVRERLVHRFSLLESGPRDFPNRHKTLRNAIAWSYDLLKPQEQSIFQQLAVFRGGWTAEAAQQILKIERSGFSTFLESLIVKSLVRQGIGGTAPPRFTMLETIREYAAERFESDPAAFELQRRHRSHYLQFAEAMVPNLYGEDLPYHLNCLELEIPNIRQAFTGLLEHEKLDACRLCNALFRYWLIRGELSEGQSWFERAIPDANQSPDRITARFHQAFGSLLIDVGKYELAGIELESALRERIEIGDQQGIAIARLGIGYHHLELGNLDAALLELDRALDSLTSVGDHAGLGVCQINRGHCFLEMLRPEEAHDAFDLAQSHFAACDDEYGFANAMACRATSLRMSGNLALATALITRSRESYLRFEDKAGLALSDGELAMILHVQGEHRQALEFARDSVKGLSEIGEHRQLAEALDTLAMILAATGNPGNAVKLLACSQAEMERIRVRPTPRRIAIKTPLLTHLRSSQPADAFDPNWQSGSSLSLHEAVDMVVNLEYGGSAFTTSPIPVKVPSNLPTT